MNKHTVKSCCGSSVIIFEPHLPIRKFQVEIFKNYQFEIPQNFYDAGIFYVQKHNLIATGSFGTAKISVRSGTDEKSLQILKEFEEVLEKAINIPIK